MSAKLSAIADRSVPIFTDELYGIEVGTPAEASFPLTRLGGLLSRGACDGRLTLTSGTAFTTADVTGATNIYFTPTGGDKITIYDGTRWREYGFSELTLALGTLTSGLPYDVFVYDNSGTLTLESLAWTNDTTRATALAVQDGILCKTGALTRRYLGSFYTTATTTTEDSISKRYLFNAYNAVPRYMRRFESTDNWSYASGTWRSANGDSANKVSFLDGLGTNLVESTVYGVVYLAVSPSGEAATVGIGIDSTTATTSEFSQGAFNANAGGTFTPVTANYAGYPGIGKHDLNWLERGNAATSCIFVGDNGESAIPADQCGIRARVVA